MKRLLIVLAILCLAMPLFAQSPAPGTPVNSETIDYFSSFDKLIYDLITAESGYFVGVAQTFLNRAAVFVLVCILIGGIASSVSGHGGLNLEYIGKHFFVPYIVISLALKYWLSPIPGLGVSFVGIFTNAAAELSAHASLATMDILNRDLNAIRDGIGPLTLLSSPIKMLMASLVTFFVGLVKAVMLFVIGGAYMGLGVGATLGPIFGALGILPPFRHLWFNWVNAMLKYSLYRVVGNIVISVWAGFVIGFLNNALAGQYDLIHLVSIASSMTFIIVAFIIGVLRAPHYVSDFTEGGHSGHGMFAAVATFVKGALL